MDTPSSTTPDYTRGHIIDVDHNTSPGFVFRTLAPVKDLIAEKSYSPAQTEEPLALMPEGVFVYNNRDDRTELPGVEGRYLITQVIPSAYEDGSRALGTRHVEVTAYRLAGPYENTYPFQLGRKITFQTAMQNICTHLPPPVGWYSKDEVQKYRLPAEPQTPEVAVCTRLEIKEGTPINIPISQDGGHLILWQPTLSPKLGIYQAFAKPEWGFKIPRAFLWAKRQRIPVILASHDNTLTLANRLGRENAEAPGVIGIILKEDARGVIGDRVEDPNLPFNVVNREDLTVVK